MSTGKYDMKMLSRLGKVSSKHQYLIHSAYCLRYLIHSILCFKQDGGGVQRSVGHNLGC
jgi:hypothetical protein